MPLNLRPQDFQERFGGFYVQRYATLWRAGAAMLHAANVDSPAVSPDGAYHVRRLTRLHRVHVPNDLDAKLVDGGARLRAYIIAVS